MNIMSKGIAVNTILMLLVGIVVAGIIIFLVYRYLIGSSLSQEECRARAISWCTLCKNSEWRSPTTMGKDLANCFNTYAFGGVPTVNEIWACRNFFMSAAEPMRKKTCGGYIPLD